MIVYDINSYYIDGGLLFSLKERLAMIIRDNTIDYRVLGVRQKTHRYDRLNMKPVEFDGVCVFNSDEDRAHIDTILIGYWKGDNGPLRGMELVEKFCDERQIDAGAWQWAEL